jgi:methionyl-tRNA formyltransferase
MNFIIITQKDILYTPIFFEKFFKSKYPGTCKGTIIQKAFGDQSYIDLIKRMYNFYGFKDFLKQGIKYIRKTFLAALYEKELYKKALSIENISHKFGIPVLPFDSVNSKEFKNWVKEQEIELIVSIAASEIFDEEILALPEKECINFHNAPLPDYRGMLPNFWQMHYDEPYSVLTVHTMTKSVDKGKIIYQQKTKIKAEYSLEDLILLTKKKSANALVEVLRQFKQGEVTYKPMSNVKGTYFTFPDRDDVKKFKSKGKQLL